MDVFKELEKLRQRHYECEDCWYSCPKSDEGCCDERYSKDECNCGADEQNKILDGIIEYLRLTQRAADLPKAAAKCDCGATDGYHNKGCALLTPANR